MSKQLKIMNVLCVIAAIFFVAMIVVTALSSGDLLTIDALFMMTFCLLMAVIFIASPLLYLYSEGKLPLPGLKRLSPATMESAGALPSTSGTAGEPVAHVASHADPRAHEEIHFSGSNKLFSMIWVILLVLTLVEILLAYVTMPLHIMLTVLLGLSIIKAALIVAYFMHLKFERLSLILSIVPMLIICICLLFIFFPDSFRSSNLRYKYQEQPPVAPPVVEEP